VAFDIDAVRRQFPALQRPAIFLDNPGGTQVPQVVVDRVRDYLTTTNANRGGAFATSRASDELLERSRQAMAQFLGAGRPEEILFGPNMTSLTFDISRSLAREFLPGDEIVVTRLDHDANIAPWLFLAEDRGCLVRWLDFDPADGRLRLPELEALLGPRTRLVAVGYASNALGTVNPVAEIARRAHAVGALCYVDAVQASPHLAIDVTALDCDFLAISTYKVFGPHLGALFGRHGILERLRAYKVRPASDRPPGKFETGTQLHENIAGALGALEYLAGLAGGGPSTDLGPALRAAMAAIGAYESGLTRHLLEGLKSVPGLRLVGVSDPARLNERVPTVSFTMGTRSPREVAEALGRDGIYVWDGDFYAPSVTERLGLAGSGGLIRVGLVHYNTLAEIDRLIEALGRLAAGA
jgi:cysteine desulfurase family protein (TIGR01976 family)